MNYNLISNFIQNFSIHKVLIGKSEILNLKVTFLDLYEKLRLHNVRIYRKFDPKRKINEFTKKNVLKPRKDI